MRYSVATHNMLRNLKRTQWLDDLLVTSDARIVAHQEAQKQLTQAALHEFCRDKDRGMFTPEGSGNLITWDKGMFAFIPNSGGVVDVHKKHPTRKYNPERDIGYCGLRMRDHQYRVLVINTHPVAGYSRPGGREGTEKNQEYNDWLDWAATQYWLDTLSLVAAEMSSERWDDILVMGDYNAPLAGNQADDEWYYPARIMDGVILSDHGKGIDHICLTRDSKSRVKRRWLKHGHSDHPFRFAQMA